MAELVVVGFESPTLTAPLWSCATTDRIPVRVPALARIAEDRISD